jgi:hypothetical protein
MSDLGFENRPPLSGGDLSILFNRYDEFDKKRTEQKKKGNNDYSLLGSVFRRISNEVNLHSRFLYSMLNPSASHGRGSMFGEAFVSALGFPDWLDWTTTHVHREHKCIDLYLTDGNRQVLIENKIHAIDQLGQVRRYINEVRNPKGSPQISVDAEDLLFVYLSNGRPGPSERSLKPYELRTTPSGSYVVDENGERVARFVNAHYRSHVLPWISTCRELVKDIDNLCYALSDYEGVVQRITRTYKSRVMSLEDFLLENSSELDSRSRVRFAFEIASMLPAIKAKWLANMFNNLDDLLDEEVRNGRLVAISKNDSPSLKPLQFDSLDAGAFFVQAGERRVANKGRFWRVAVGPACDAAALAILFGKEMLHIGLLPIGTGGSRKFEFNQGAELHTFDLKSGGQVFQVRSHGPIRKTFKGLVSWTVPLDKEIEHLATFENGRVAHVVKALVTRALECDALFQPATDPANESLP